MSRILWVSPYAIHDTSSGAAIFALSILRFLKCIEGRDFEIRSLSGFVFDHERGSAKFENFEALQQGSSDFFSFEQEGITYDYVRTHHVSEFDMSNKEQDLFFQKFMDIVYSFKPDFIMGYGGDLMTLSIFDKAHRLGIPTAYLLCNGNHRGFAFPGFDRVLCEAQATADFYGKNYGVNVSAFGTIIDKSKVIADKKKGRYITFVNPAPEKGLSFFVKIAHIFAERYKDIRFLVVTSRAALDNNIASLKEFNESTNEYQYPYDLTMFKNIDIASHTADISLVYEQTRVLLAPSLWFEAWGRVASEATFNDIPVLASTSGGLVEAVAGGGKNIAISQACHDDYMLLPSDEEIEPWVQALYDMYVHAEDWQEACRKASAQNDVTVSLRRLLNIIDPLLNKHAGDHLL